MTTPTLTMFAEGRLCAAGPCHGRGAVLREFPAPPPGGGASLPWGGPAGGFGSTAPGSKLYAARGAAIAGAAFSIFAKRARRIGRRTNHAISAATAFMAAATMNTECQPPDCATSTLDSGTSNDAVPFAVYNAPAFAAAYCEPNVSVHVDGNRL